MPENNVIDLAITEHAVGPLAAPDLVVARPPEVVLAEAHRAARALKTVLDGKPKPLFFGGKRYLEFEDWLMMARFYGVGVRYVSTHECEYAGAKGWEARADAIRISDGMVIGSADAMCLADEPNWRGKPQFQLRSMAQTRAGSKALALVLRFAVVLAGYAGTPWEEVSDMARPAARAPIAGGFITPAQRRKLIELADANRHAHADVQQWLLETYGVGQSKEIARKDYEAIITRLTDPTPLRAEVADPEYLPPDEGTA